MMQLESELLTQRLVVLRCRQLLTIKERRVDELRSLLDEAEKEMSEHGTRLHHAKEKLITIALHDAAGE